jgi:hypothetical protein
MTRPVAEEIVGLPMGVDAAIAELVDAVLAGLARPES